MKRPHALWSWRLLLGLALCGLLAGCGFRLKGATPLPFDTVYTNITENTLFTANLRRALVASSPGLRFVDDPAQAQALLTRLEHTQWLRQLSIDARGRVEEYELNLRYRFQLTDARGHLILPPNELHITRDVPYDPDAVQAKQGEIDSVFLDMQQVLVDAIVRRLTAPEVRERYAQADAQPLAETLPDLPPTTLSTPPPSPRVEPGMQPLP